MLLESLLILQCENIDTWNLSEQSTVRLDQRLFEITLIKYDILK